MTTIYLNHFEDRPRKCWGYTLSNFGNVKVKFQEDHFVIEKTIGSRTTEIDVKSDAKEADEKAYRVALIIGSTHCRKKGFTLEDRTDKANN